MASDLPPNLLGDYHLKDNTSPAYNLGAASKSGVNAPGVDFDDQARPALGAFDAGADELVGATADLAVTTVADLTTVSPAGTASFTVTVSNLGPGAVTAAPVTGASLGSSASRLPATTWTCTASAGGSCTGGANGGTVTLSAAGTATFTVTGTVTTINGNQNNSGSFTYRASRRGSGRHHRPADRQQHLDLGHGDHRGRGRRPVHHQD